tara:strand:- start:40 stop:180 length:141 start_codon:yes stop_codon:yes gene_type:complete
MIPDFSWSFPCLVMLIVTLALVSFFAIIIYRKTVKNYRCSLFFVAA